MNSYISKTIPFRIIAFLFVSPFIVFAQDQKQADISIEIHLKKVVFLRDEPILVRVELTNEGNKDIYVGRMLPGVDSDAVRLKFHVRNTSGEESPGMMGVLDCFEPKPQALLLAVSRDWIALPPGFSYAYTANLSSSGSFGFLKQAGRYRISAEYISGGINSQLAARCVTKAKPEEIATLPFTAWEGKIESKSVWIKVADPRE